MPQPIVEDFAAIHARMLALRAKEPAAAIPESPALPRDFYGWLTSGNLWLHGG